MGRRIVIALLFAWGLLHQAHAQDGIYSIGLARAEITPDHPVRLFGYAARGKESEGVEQKIYAKALAVGTDEQGPAILLTIDSIGVPRWMVEEVARRLEKAGIQRHRFTVASSHSHTTPGIKDAIPNMFGGTLPKAHEERIEQYTQLMLQRMEAVALEALKNRRPGRLAFTQGKVGFAANRRTNGGPVDHSLPLLRVTDPDGSLRGVLFNYACHCTTLGPELNKICGDWAGYAQEYIEQSHPGVTAMVSIGCGADANPSPRPGLKFSQQHGRSIADEVSRLLKTNLKSITAKLDTRFKRIDLPFDTLPTRAEWERMAKLKNEYGALARNHLAKLDRGETISQTLPYSVQTWAFGDQLAMVFLPGEVVVDYALRLKREFDPNRLWVTGYANDVPCYIPSRRILQEGGYEGGGAMVWYNLPTRLAPATEDLIIRTAHELLPQSLRTEQSKAEFPPPLSPAEALAAFELADKELVVDLVASEPLIVDPVAIDWGTDGKLWVVEMHDYPSGLHGNGTPGGRIKYLEDTDGDGKYDKATTFLDNLLHPTGVLAWKKGVFVCAAPDLFYAEDTDGDGRADVKKALFTGFSNENQQWIVNGLTMGLDGWIYGASSVRNNPIKVHASPHAGSASSDAPAQDPPSQSDPANPSTVALGNRDFRFHPETLVFEPAGGRSQWGRIRDDFGNWFGNDNSNLLWHYPMPEHYLRRNPHVPAPGHSVTVAAFPDHNRLYPASKTLARYNDLSHVNRVTSACGPAIYRDNLLGEDYYGNAFICEAVHNVVTRLVLEPRGVTFTGTRAPGETSREFLASRDNWFRPAQVRTGPDGALWVVDMYRFLIEHPRWITPGRLAEIDLRAGEDKGRIYRVYPRAKPPRRVPLLTSQRPEQLAQLIDSPNGTLRDLVHQRLLDIANAARSSDAADPTAQQLVRHLQETASRSEYPAARAHALHLLSRLNSPDPIVAALNDAQPHVRRAAVVALEPHLSAPRVLEAVLRRTNDPDPAVRYQIAFTLGVSTDDRVSAALAAIAALSPSDSWLRAAVLSSSTRKAHNVLRALSAHVASDLIDLRMKLITTAAREGRFREVLEVILPSDDIKPTHEHLTLMSGLLSALDAEQQVRGLIPADRLNAWRALSLFARQECFNVEAPEMHRVAAITAFGRLSERAEDEMQALSTLISPSVPVKIQQAAVSALSYMAQAGVAAVYCVRWRDASPVIRAAIIDTLLSRDDWTRDLVDALQRNAIRSSDIDAARKDRLLKHRDESIRVAASKLFTASLAPSRSDVLQKYQPTLKAPAHAGKGLLLFAKACASCHAVSGIGHTVGPDLTTLNDRSTPYLLTHILDPNAAIDGKFTAYLVETRDGRALSGVIIDETASSLTILQGGNVRDTVLRSDIRKMRSTGLSLMPEGLEEGIPPAEMAHLIAFVQAADKLKALAKRIKDPKNSDADRSAAVKEAGAELQVPLLAELVSDLAPRSPDENRLIPWIWRCAIAAGRRNDAVELRSLLEVSLPQLDKPLTEWQAVVIGGGVINGVSLSGPWPGARVKEIVEGHDDLARRWDRAIDLSFAMANDAKVIEPTRYDALRMIPLAPWERARPVLLRYLARGTSVELQQGAVSGLADVPNPEAGKALADAIPYLPEHNRNLALDALLRDEGRMQMLLDAVESGMLKPDAIGKERRQTLLDAKVDAVRQRAEKLLK